MAGSKPAFASPLEKIHPMGANPEGGLEQTGGQVFKGLDALRVSKAMGQGNASTSPSASWGDMLTTPGSRFGLSAREAAIAETASGNCEFLCSQLLLLFAPFLLYPDDHFGLSSCSENNGRWCLWPVC